MNGSRFVRTAAAIFVFALAWNGLVHLVLLREVDMALEEVARPAAQRSLPLALLLTAGIALLFSYSHAAMVRPRGILRGLWHGAYFGLVAGLLVDLNQYLLYPIPAATAAAWFVFGFAEFCAYGVIAAWAYPIRMLPPEAAPAARSP